MTLRNSKTDGCALPDARRASKTSSRRRQALRYAALGWLVLPLHTVKDGICSCSKRESCDRPGKHPMTPHGVKDATTDRDQIRNCWTESQKANIGIAPGRKSGILVLDIDPRNGGSETLKKCEAELGRLPDTVTADTGGGGDHFFFEYPSFTVRKDNSGKLFGAGVDVLSDDCIAVAPPSRHVSGKRYAWVEGKSFKDLKPAKLPQAWLERVGGSDSDRIFPEGLQAQPADAVSEGSRNNYLTSLAGTLHRSGASPAAITAALVAENTAKCSPPLDESEVEKIVASITKYSPGTSIGDGVDAAEGLMQQVLDRDFGGGRHLMLGADGRFWHYDIRLWRPVPDHWVSGKVLETIQRNSVRSQKTAALLTQVVTLLKAKLAVKDDVLAFVAEAPPVINCTNGELWIAADGSVDLRPHRPQSHLRHCLDVAYDPSAQCPEYDKALLEIFGAVEKPESMVRHWNELVGYVIQSKRNIPLVPVLLGKGGNGKTVLIRTVIQLLGTQLVLSQRIEDLEKSRFAMGSLLDKKMLVDDDVRAGARLPDGILKTISEAKEVSGDALKGMVALILLQMNRPCQKAKGEKP